MSRRSDDFLNKPPDDELPGDDTADEIVYEDFDDLSFDTVDPDALDAIDLDALDAPVEAESAPKPEAAPALETTPVPEKALDAALDTGLETAVDAALEAAQAIAPATAQEPAEAAPSAPVPVPAPEAEVSAAPEAAKPEPEPAPVARVAPVAEAAPVVEPAPAAEPAPVEKAVSSEKAASAEKPASTEEPIPAVDTVVAAKPTPAAKRAPAAKDTVSGAEKAPAAEEASKPAPKPAARRKPRPKAAAAEPSAPTVPAQAVPAQVVPARAEAAPPASDQLVPGLLIVYRALLLLGDEAAAPVRDLRAVGGVVTMPPPGIALTATFKTEHLEAVEVALSEWSQTHLPLTVTLTGVLAEVRKTNQYIAAWTLADDPKLERVQAALAAALSEHIDPTNAVSARFAGRITIGDHVEPIPYPDLIGAMQRDFEPLTLTLEQTILAQTQPQVRSSGWTVARTFGRDPGDYHTRE